MPSLYKDFEYDVFISYRLNDNRSGWVTEFVRKLNEELSATIKQKVSVYFDSNAHDGLLETHHVEDTLSNKLKCIIFIPIISQTYCDPDSFAWKNEFLVFKLNASEQASGLKVRLLNGNVTSRILPVRINELDPEDKSILESQIGAIRSIDFIFRQGGVNRPLRVQDDDVREINGGVYYCDQINKVANAIKDILVSFQAEAPKQSLKNKRAPVSTSDKVIGISAGLVFFLCFAIYFLFFFKKRKPVAQNTGVNKSVMDIRFASAGFETLNSDWLIYLPATSKYS